MVIKGETNMSTIMEELKTVLSVPGWKDEVAEELERVLILDEGAADMDEKLDTCKHLHLLSILSRKGRKVVPHHGSRFSADEEIYMRLKEKGARLAVVSAGQNNRYGHPHQEVLEYLNASHIAVHRTDQEGAVCLNLNEGKKSRIETSKSIGEKHR